MGAAISEGGAIWLSLKDELGWMVQVGGILDG